MLNCLASERENQYANLDNFTKETHGEITEATCALGWTMGSVEIDSDRRLICPYDWSHRVGKKMLDQHLEHCQWKQQGYHESDVPLPDSSLPVNSRSSIKLDCHLRDDVLREAKRTDPTMKIGSGERVIPRTSARIFADFSSDERKVLYEFVVSNTAKPDMGCDVTDIQKTENKDTEDKRLSFLELLIQERNLKRRRAKHRGVHTNKKSRTEILREIIDRQMQFYTDYVSETRATNSSRKNANATVCEIASPDMKLEGSPRYQESSSSREKSDGSCGGSRDSRIVTESTRMRKLRKRKRSRSRDHDRDSRRDKRGHTRTRYRRSDSKRCETDRSFDWQENL